MRRNNTFPETLILLLIMMLISLSVSCARRLPAAALVSLGDSVEAGGWRVTVQSFTALPGDPWRQPAMGNRFYAVELSVENTSGEIRYVMPERQMILQGPGGREFTLSESAGILSARQRQWLVVQGEVGAGQRLSGAASYEAPADCTACRFVFRAELSPFSEAVTFALGDPAEQ